MMEKPEKAHIKRIPIKDNLSSGVVVITEDNRAIGKNKGIFNGYHTLSTGKRNLGKKIVQENYKKLLLILSRHRSKPLLASPFILYKYIIAS